MRRWRQDKNWDIDDEDKGDDLKKNEKKKKNYIQEIKTKDGILLFSKIIDIG